ncbi:conserved hypothetical protein [Thiomonas sp. X19]|nr:conserved hypothetical protein [Thiomonas sp. X19]
MATMQHRHLNHQDYTLAAIDDVISRGKRDDWEDLRAAILDDSRLADKVLRVCRPHAAERYAQRHHFWAQYVRRHGFAA